jgi:hypothetical protein
MYSKRIFKIGATNFECIHFYYRLQFLSFLLFFENPNSTNVVSSSTNNSFQRYLNLACTGFVPRP